MLRFNLYLDTLRNIKEKLDLIDKNDNRQFNLKM